jgi:hypothetical protein
MNIAWNYVAVGLLTIATAAGVVVGEPANAELRLAEAATRGVGLLCFAGTAEPGASSAAVPAVE